MEPDCVHNPETMVYECPECLRKYLAANPWTEDLSESDK